MEDFVTSYNKKELEILKLAHRFLIFIDEVGDPFVHSDLNIYKDPSVFPVMTVTALVVSRTVYQEILMPGLDEIKQDFFNNKDIYFHSREIRRKDGIFKIFLDEALYSKFKDKMDRLLEKSSITIISSSINKVKFVEKVEEFQIQAGTPYNIGNMYLRNIDYVLERLGHFLQGESGKIIFEIRGKKESKRIQGVLAEAKQNGTFYCPKETFKGIADKILFFTKKDNINGLQVVDYCTYPFARHAKNSMDTDNKFFDILRRYIYKGDFGEYGLKEWP